MSLVDEIKLKADIVEVISSYVNLQNSGRNFKANCPFHEERTPSFVVAPERQSWRCYKLAGNLEKNRDLQSVCRRFA